MIKICKQCNNEFKAKERIRLFCNHSCYSKSLIGSIPWNKNIKAPKISKSKIGHIVTQETRDKISKTLTGRIRPDFEKEKISKNNAKYWLGKERLSMKGKNHFAYIEDRTKLKKIDHRRTTADIYWVREIKKLDNFKCRINNEDCKGKLEAHHILEYAKFPELRYDINNGITLCHFHHPYRHSDVVKLTPYFKELILQR